MFCDYFYLKIEIYLSNLYLGLIELLFLNFIMKKVTAQDNNKLITPKKIIKIFIVNSSVIFELKKLSSKNKYIINTLRSKKLDKRNLTLLS